MGRAGPWRALLWSCWLVATTIVLVSFGRRCWVVSARDGHCWAGLGWLLAGTAGVV